MVGIMLGGPGDGHGGARGGHGVGDAGGRSQAARRAAGAGRATARAVAMELETQAAEAKRLAALQVLDGLGQGKISFEDMWHTTEFQKRMLDLCRSLYGDADAQYRFNLLNDVRNDLTADGKKALEKLFENYSQLGGDRGILSGMGVRASTMDFCELKACLVDLGCFPSAKNKDWVLPKGQRMLTKNVMASIFAAVNDNMEGLDDDAHEFSFEEFYVAMCMISVYCNKPMDAIVFPNSMKTENLEDLNKKMKPNAKESSASQMAALVKPEHMRIIQEMFEECHGEMTVEQFIESLGLFMGMAPKEAETMFLKIDYNGDGGITWSEFSNYVLALGEMSTSADDRVLVSLINPRMSLEYLHKDAISAAAIVPANRWRPGADKYVTFSKDGPINIWGGAQGNPLRQDAPFSLKGAAAFVFSACAMVMYNVVLVSSNDEKIRFYSFEPRFKQDLEYDCEDCVAHSTHCFAARLGPEQSWVSWFVWGDNLGRVHVVPEATISEYRVQSTAHNIAHVKTSAVKLQHTSGLKWRNIGTTRPATGRQIQNSKLAEAILAMKDLKEREWESFGISELGIDDYILAGENYFQPAEHADKAYTRSMFTGFVTAIQYIAGAGPHGLLVMCSNDANVVMFDPATRSITRRFQGHSLAVKCVTWVRNYRSVASSGLDRDILLWDPTTGHRTGRYRGHKAAVVSMCYFDRTEVLFSLDLRYQLYVWDTSKQTLLTQINTDAGDPFVTKHRQRSQLMLLNELRGHLAICGKRPYIWKIREEEKKADGAVMHDTALLSVIYNDLFSQIITVDYAGLVGIWEIQTGQQCFSFRITEKFPDGSQVSITAAILDPIKRCVALGLANGKIVTHNCQNGVAVNEFLTAEAHEQRSTHPITSLHFSESGEDGCENVAAHAQLFATGHQLSGVTCVWQWRTAFDTEKYEILVSKVMLLPNWREDWAIDYSHAIHSHANLIACGRVDGRVIVWNGQTGFLKKELDNVFWAMDRNNDGSLSRDEVWTFLRDREGYDEHDFDLFWKSCDVDASGEISKTEFNLALGKRGTVARIDSETGKIITERLGSQLVFTKFIKRLQNVILMVTADGWAMFTNWRNGQLLFLMNVNPGEHVETEIIGENSSNQNLVTCCAMDEKESKLIVGTSCGYTKMWDVSNVGDKLEAKDGFAKMLGSFKSDHYDEVTAVSFIQEHSIVLVCGSSNDGKTLPSVTVWDMVGTRLGQLGGEEGWALDVSEQDQMFQKLKAAAASKRMSESPTRMKKSEIPEDALIGDPDFVKFLSNQAREQEAIAGKKTLRDTQLVKESGLLKGSIISILNRNHFKLKAFAARELHLRLGRAKLFLQTRMPESLELHARTLKDLEDAWSKELAAYSLSAFTHPIEIPSGLSIEEKAVMKALDNEDRARLLVKQFVLEHKSTHFMLPPSDDLTEQVFQYVLSQSQAAGATASEARKSSLWASAITKLPENSQAPWIHRSIIRSFLTAEVMNVHIVQGGADVNDMVADEESLPLEVQTRVFRSQYGSDPCWQPTDSREITKRTFRVAGEVQTILGRKDILASNKRDWVSRFAESGPGNIPIQQVVGAQSEASKTVMLGSEIGAVHHHLLGPISLRRCTARGPTGVAELEQSMPYPGDPAPDTAKWRDVYMHQLCQPFQLEPASIIRESIHFEDIRDKSALEETEDNAEVANVDSNPLGKIGGQDKGAKDTSPAKSKRPHKNTARGSANRKFSNVQPNSLDSMAERLTAAFELELEKPHLLLLEADTVSEKKTQPTAGRGDMRVHREDHQRAGLSAFAKTSKEKGLARSMYKEKGSARSMHLEDKKPEAMPCSVIETEVAAQGEGGRNAWSSRISPGPLGRFPHSPTQPRSSPAQPKFRELRMQNRQSSEGSPQPISRRAQMAFSTPDAVVTQAKTPRVWTCKWTDSPPLNEHLLPVIPNTGSLEPVSRVASASPDHPQGAQRKPALQDFLWVGVGDSPKVAHWYQRMLSFEIQHNRAAQEGVLYLLLPLTDENGQPLPGSKKTVVCHVNNETSVERIEDDLGSAGRCGAIVLEWGLKDDRLRLFLAARESTTIVEWLIGLRRAIDMIKEETVELVFQKMRIFESRKQARATLRLIRKTEDLDVKAERERAEATRIREQHRGLAQVSVETAPPTARSATNSTGNTTTEPSRASSAPSGSAAQGNAGEEGQVVVEEARQPSPSVSDIPHT